jgi:hypothetical protein
MTQTPTIGRIVHVLLDPRSNNGSDVAPAIVTRVWNEGLINARVFTDTASSATVDSLTSCTLYQAEDDARAALSQLIENYKEANKGEGPELKHVAYAFWPAVPAAKPTPEPAEPAPADTPPAPRFDSQTGLPLESVPATLSESTPAADFAPTTGAETPHPFAGHDL